MHQARIISLGRVHRFFEARGMLPPSPTPFYFIYTTVKRIAFFLLQT